MLYVVDVGDAKMRDYIDYIEHGVSINVHGVDDDSFVEAPVLGSEADKKSVWRGLHHLARIKESNRVFQRISDLPCGMFQARLCDRL